MAETIQQAGEVSIDSIILQSSDRKTNQDLTFLFMEIDIFEDIYSPAMHGTMTMIDGFNLISLFPILGEELLIISYHTPTMKSINKTFAVTGVTNKSIDNNKQVYLVNFISQEAMNDVNNRVYRAFAGTPSDSVLQIFNTYFPRSKINIETTSNSLKIVAPTITPFALIGLFARKSIDTSSYGAPSFLFYEDNQGYNFVSMNRLLSMSPSLTYRYSASLMRERLEDGTSVRDINAEFSNVKVLDFELVNDTLDKVVTGTMGKKVIEVDIIRKSFTKRTYSYLDNFKDVSHTDANPVNSVNFLHSNDAIVETSFVHPLLHDGFHSDKDGVIKSKRIPLLHQTEFIKMNMTIHGRTDLKVGDTINFEMGVFSTSSDDNLYSNRIDPYYSGKYLVTAMQHRLTKTRHETIAQIVKDGFPNPIKFM